MVSQLFSHVLIQNFRYCYSTWDTKLEEIIHCVYEFRGATKLQLQMKIKFITFTRSLMAFVWGVNYLTSVFHSLWKCPTYCTSTKLYL